MAVIEIVEELKSRRRRGREGPRHEGRGEKAPTGRTKEIAEDAAAESATAAAVAVDDADDVDGRATRRLDGLATDEAASQPRRWPTIGDDEADGCRRDSRATTPRRGRRRAEGPSARAGRARSEAEKPASDVIAPA